MKVREIIEYFNIDIILPMKINNIELNLEEMFNKCEYKEDIEYGYYRRYTCTYSENPKIRLIIYVSEEDEFDELVFFGNIDDPKEGIKILPNGEKSYVYEFPCPANFVSNWF